ncbi:hypothetical protein Achl_4455 (plasmid) [Pseudarthrobacter chlorophenolicus A6]|uniref:Uncharacterized protein n=1 Tax=Pseudarthrobacter chlorophenolicus (strain ATCC 700700 / DSM 12829 / CIP 107037 / JCM 12360 / KCTC 9906 / NCIMB 13794 / A6) TaxID=452863 RepID=B8HJ09_PSECP|nr:hypothetical protein [Pseudarthrobacter chlorophenolicus]ACL42406.1 hypothetical protein Achl_4455 [Pseudarthrobacter chlorophenolicus A6]SDQ17699.1 hypothetical protein SAMN04489738_0512 [Pseudarthrobacter chlorophenolicus]
MTTLLAPAAPAVGARYRNHSTGRTWHVLKICDSGLISLGEEYYGTDCERRVYLTDEELGAGYALNAGRVGGQLPHT